MKKYGKKWNARVYDDTITDSAIVEKHGLFQTYYYNHLYGQDKNLREKYIGHPHYVDTINFCHKWDQASFDPNYKTLPLEEFIPMVGRIFSREPYINQ